MSTLPPRHAIGVRPTLQALIVLLLVATALALTLLSFLAARQNKEGVVRQLTATGVTQVTEDVSTYLASGPRSVADLDARATYGRLPLDDRDALLEFLADRIRYDQNIGELMYGDEDTGDLFGARRTPNNQVIAVHASPAINGGRPEARVMNVDGSSTPYDDVLPVELDARARPWYRAAAAVNDRLVWVGPFASFNGPRVLSTARDVRDPVTGVLLGVWAAHFDVDSLPAMLSAAEQRPDAQVVLLTRAGHVIATASPNISERLEEATAALPAPLASLPVGTTIPVGFAFRGEHWVGGMRGITIGPDEDWFVGYYLRESDLLSDLFESERTALAAAVVVLLLGVMLGAILADRIAKPLRAIAVDLSHVAEFQISATPSPRSIIEEIVMVSDAADRMKASLRSFARFVPTGLVRDLLAEGAEAQLGGETRLLTIHFSDITSFTHLSEHLTPAEVGQSLAEYFDCMTAAVHQRGGTIDKFIGDGLMAFWNAPGWVPDHPREACLAALEAQDHLCVLQDEWQRAGKPVFRARIGLHTGEALVGNFGSSSRFSYTALGDSVNLASRLEGMNKVYGTSIIASESVREAVGDEMEWRHLDRVAVVGRSEPTSIYELLGVRGSVCSERLHARDLYEQALDASFTGLFDEAQSGFDAAAAAWPTDLAARVMSARSSELSAHPPAVAWDGVYRPLTKA